MRSKTIRRGVWGGLSLVLAASTLPAFGATPPGRITITSPAPRSYVRGVVPIEWSFSSGRYVKSTSKVDVLLTSDGFTWSRLARVGIRTGGYDVNTAAIPDTAYAVRVKLYSSTVSIYSTVSPLFIDNTAPVGRITRPTAGDVIVDDQQVARVTVVAGRTTLQAETDDNYSGVAQVIWKLDDAEIGTGNPYTHDFNTAQPGEHILSATVVDFAGNSTTTSVGIVTLVGPSAVGNLEEVPSPDPSAVPTPDPSGTPSPDPSTLPSPDPSMVPDPTTLVPPGIVPEGVITPPAIPA